MEDPGHGEGDQGAPEGDVLAEDDEVARVGGPERELDEADNAVDAELGEKGYSRPCFERVCDL